MAAPTPDPRARLRYDRAKRLALASLFTFAKQTRKQWDSLAARIGKTDPAALTKEARSLRTRLEPQIYGEMSSKLAPFDPEKGTPQARDDLDFLLHLLVADYPDAVLAAIAGEQAELADVRKEADRLSASFEGWNRRVRAGKP